MQVCLCGALVVHGGARNDDRRVSSQQLWRGQAASGIGRQSVFYFLSSPPPISILLYPSSSSPKCRPELPLKLVLEDRTALSWSKALFNKLYVQLFRQYFQLVKCNKLGLEFFLASTIAPEKCSVILILFLGKAVSSGGLETG